MVAKVLAASSIFLWLLVIVAGRYMPMFEDTLDPRFVSAQPSEAGQIVVHGAQLPGPRIRD
jgi:hypothetical protein